MKTNVRESSIENHHFNQATMINQSKAQVIVDYVYRYGSWMTRRQIAEGTGIETATVSGRVNTLIAEGMLVECDERDKRPCPITGRMVLWVCHKDRIPGQQLDIFGGTH